MLDEIVSEINKEGLIPVSSRRGIKLTVKGKVDRRSSFGKLLYDKLEEQTQKCLRYS